MPTDDDILALAARLDEEPRYQLLDISGLQFGRDITAAARYRVGDLIRVPRSDGGWSLGVVCEKHSEGRVRVVLRSREDRSLSLKELNESMIAAHNALKIGDYVALGTTTFWVTGLDSAGQLAVVTHSGQRVDAAELRARLDAEITRNVMAMENTLIGVPQVVAPPPAKKLMIAGATTVVDEVPAFRPEPPAHVDDGGERVPLEQILSGDLHPVAVDHDA